MERDSTFVRVMIHAVCRRLDGLISQILESDPSVPVIFLEGEDMTGLESHLHLCLARKS